MRVWFLTWKDPLEEEMAAHSGILAWELSWTEEPGGLRSILGFPKRQPSLRAHAHTGHPESNSSRTPIFWTNMASYNQRCDCQIKCSSIIISPKISKFSYEVYYFYSCEGEKNFSKVSLNSAKLKWLAQGYIPSYERRVLERTSLVVQRLRLWALNAGNPGSIPAQGTRSHRSQLRPSTAK